MDDNRRRRQRPEGRCREGRRQMEVREGGEDCKVLSQFCLFIVWKNMWTEFCLGFFLRRENHEITSHSGDSLSHTHRQTHKYAQTDNKSVTKKVKLGCVQWITVHFHCWSLTPPHRWRHGSWRKLICFEALFPDLSSPLALMWFQSRLKTSWFLHFSASCHSGWNRTDIERIFSAPRYIKEHQNFSILSKKMCLNLNLPNSLSIMQIIRSQQGQTCLKWSRCVFRLWCENVLLKHKMCQQKLTSVDILLKYYINISNHFPSISLSSLLKRLDQFLELANKTTNWFFFGLWQVQTCKMFLLSHN